MIATGTQEIEGPLTCSVCGRSSIWRDAFKSVKDGTVTRLCCPKCAPRKAATLRNNGLMMLAVAAGFATASLIAGDDHRFGLIFAIWALFVAFTVLLVPFHELGHVFAARLVGTRAYAVVIGREPWIVDREWVGMRWRIGSTVGGGLTYCGPIEGPRERLRRLVILSGGVVVNLLVAIGSARLAAVLSRTPGRSPIVFALLVLAAASAVQFAQNLWPRIIESSIGKIKNDGAKILALLRGAPLESKTASALMHSMLAMFAIHDRRFSRAANEAMLAETLWNELGAPDARDSMIGLRAVACAESDDAATAVRLLEPLQGAREMNLGVRAAVEGNLAWAYLLLDEADLLERALTLLESARRISPWETTYAIAEACVLAAASDAVNQRVVKARLLLAGIEREKLERQSAAYAALAKGLCAAAEGDFAAATRQRDGAKSLGATAAPLRVLERRIPSR